MHAAAGLDPADRALLDLWMRQDLPDGALATAAGIPVETVSARKLDIVEHQVLAAVGARKGLPQGMNIEERGGHGNTLSQPEFAFGVEIERPPEQAIDDDDEQAHHDDAEHDAMEVAGIGLLGNIGAKSERL